MAMADDWGRNPEVRKMRRIFQEMESGQAGLIRAVNISEFDLRLRGWRDKARLLFERLWPKAAAFGSPDDKRLGRLYVYCLARILYDDGIPVPETCLPEDKEIQRLVKGGLL